MQGYFNKSIRIALFLIVFPSGVYAGDDPAAGKEIFKTCATCHGLNAEGNLTTKSPKLTGQLDTYLIVQIQNFRNGMRGGKPKDILGAQMAVFAKNIIG